MKSSSKGSHGKGMPNREITPERMVFFGPFRLAILKRLLFEGDRVIRLGSKAAEILAALVERPGELVSRRELLRIAWPDTIVVEANLTVQMAALRRALGESDGANRYIVNSPGLGYRFVAPIKVLDGKSAGTEKLMAAPATNLPAQLTRLVGRAETVRKLEQKLNYGRLLSIVGPPGVGKTSIALRLAESIMPQFRNGVWLIDLSSVNSGLLIPGALASALRAEVPSSDSLSDIAAALRYKNLLLLFDNCEHLLEEVALAVGAVLRAAAHVSILTTSREPLRIEGEQVFRLPALDVPPLANIHAKEALAYPAIQLLVERAEAIVNDLKLSEADIAHAARICRGLDGNPLAIEMAAARVDAFGIAGLAELMADRMNFLTDIRRGKPARQRTISAALDWSYQLLNEREKAVLRSLGVFAGSFTLDAAIAVVPETDAAATILADLVGKSLLSIDVTTDETRFRLLEITKAFAVAKLAEQAEYDGFAERLASFLIEMLQDYVVGPNQTQALRGAALELDNIRGILDWATSASDQNGTEISLLVASVPVWLENSLLSECMRRTSKVIVAIEKENLTERQEMILKAAFGLSAMYTEGMSPEALDALNRSIELATLLKDPQWELRVRIGVVLFLQGRGDMKGASAGVERIETLVAETDEPTIRATMKSVKSASRFFLADYSTALTLAREAHEYFQNHSTASRIGRWGLNHSIYAQCVIARAHWSLGHFDRTVAACLLTHSDAEEAGNSTWICQALSWCNCSLFLAMEDLDRAEEAIRRFKQVSEESNHASYAATAVGYEGRLLFHKGKLGPAERKLREALSRLGDARYEGVYIAFLGRLAELLNVDGRLDEAFVASTEYVARAKATQALWLLPDALRINGEVLWSLEGPSQKAEAYLRESFEIALGQQAIAWQLRSANSLARMLVQQGRKEHACSLLESVLGKFVEGFESVPYRRLKAQLDHIQLRLPGG
jgi:predicted ATPase/DNA-binding winged helix-turn-helix (wHTH) protein